MTHVRHCTITGERQIVINELSHSGRCGGAANGSAHATSGGTVRARPTGPVLGIRGIVDGRVEVAGIGIDGHLVSPAPDTIVYEAHAHAAAHLELQAAIDGNGAWPRGGAVSPPELSEDLCEARGQVVV